MEQTAKKEVKTFSNQMRIVFKGFLDAIGGFFTKLGLSPNAVTLAGVIGNIIGAVILAYGHLTIGAVVILIMGILDVVDGTMARLQGKSSKMGSFIDSVSDRYSELFIFGGLIVFYSLNQNWVGCFLAYAASAGSILVSYIRAKAESLGYQAQIGILSRLERYIVLVPALFFQRPDIGLLIIAVLGNFTALQRVFYVLRQCKEK